MFFTFNHFNFNVLDLDRSLNFYKCALHLREAHRKEREDFTLVYLGDGETGFAGRQRISFGDEGQGL